MTPEQIASSGSESAHQKALFAWAAVARLAGFARAWHASSYAHGVALDPAYVLVPELRWLHAIPNGGKRDAVTAGRLKAEGVKAGVPDVFLPVARNGMHGLYIEMKIGANKPTPEQAEFLAYLQGAAYSTDVCYTWREAAQRVQGYLSGDV